MSHFVAISGNIGVGKTTITRLVAERLGWKPFYEPVIDNPYLDDFYDDMTKWAFHLQIYFLSKRFEAQREITSTPNPCIQDRTIYEDVEIFARILHRRGHISPRDYDNYRSLFAVMVSFIRPPDLVVYLRADVDELVERIYTRGRESEKNIDRGYLEELNRSYEGWSERAAKICPVKIIDTSGLDLESNGGVVDKMVEEIKQRFGLMF